MELTEKLLHSEDVMLPCGKRRNYRKIELLQGEGCHVILLKHLCSSLTHVLETLEKSST